MNQKIIIFALLAITFLEACSKKENAVDNNITQRITGAGDCINCDGWSWNNGEAATTKNGENDSCFFSFKSTISGELSFYHAYQNYSYDVLLDVSIGKKTYFHSESESYRYAEAPSSIGSVKVGDTVVFIGRRCRVKDIKIVGERENNTNDNQNNPQWDF